MSRFSLSPLQVASLDKAKIDNDRARLMAAQKTKPSVRKRELVAGGDIKWKPVDKQAAMLLAKSPWYNHPPTNTTKSHGPDTKTTQTQNAHTQRVSGDAIESRKGSRIRTPHEEKHVRPVLVTQGTPPINGETTKNKAPAGAEQDRKPQPKKELRLAVQAIRSSMNAISKVFHDALIDGRLTSKEHTVIMSAINIVANSN
jgi:hypothetical protein